MQLVLDDTPESRDELARRHGMHRLKGEWAGREECPVANAGDWLLIWLVVGDEAYFERTGTHEELFA